MIHSVGAAPAGSTPSSSAPFRRMCANSSRSSSDFRFARSPYSDAHNCKSHLSVGSPGSGVGVNAVIVVVPAAFIFSSPKKDSLPKCLAETDVSAHTT